MDERTQAEYDRIAAGPHSGEFSFLHHEGPVVEHSVNVMERVADVLCERPDKPASQQHDRLRHIYWLDPVKIPAIAQVKLLRDAYEAQVKLLRDAYEAQVKPLRDAYEAQVKLLRDACGEAQVKPLWDAYEAQVKLLWDACGEAQVKPLRDACEAQVKLLWDACGEAQVKLLRDAYEAQVKLLRDAYEAQVKPLRDEILVYLRSLIPNCGWDGKTIFGKKE